MKWRTSCLVALLVASWIMGASLAHAVEYTFQTIDYPEERVAPLAEKSVKPLVGCSNRTFHGRVARQKYAGHLGVDRSNAGQGLQPIQPRHLVV